MQELIRRGNIYWVEASPVIGSEQWGLRPAVILSNDIGNAYAPIVEVAFLTREKRWMPTHVKVKAVQESIVLCEQITTLSKSRLVSFIKSATPEEMEEIDKAVKISLGLY